MKTRSQPIPTCPYPQTQHVPQMAPGRGSTLKSLLFNRGTQPFKYLPCVPFHQSVSKKGDVDRSAQIENTESLSIPFPMHYPQDI